jgi:hypothetical protein
VASQAVRIFQKVGLQAQAKRGKGKRLDLLYILLYVTMREKEIKKELNFVPNRPILQNSPVNNESSSSKQVANCGKICVLIAQG